MTNEEKSIYELAYALRMPVYKLLNEMPYDEFLNWIEYFNEKPVGWREDDRTFKLLQAQGLKCSPADIFPSLGAMMKIKKNNSGLMSSVLGSKLLQAVGGDTIPL